MGVKNKSNKNLSVPLNHLDFFSFEDDPGAVAGVEQEEPGRLELGPEDAAVHDGEHHHGQLRRKLTDR